MNDQITQTHANDDPFKFLATFSNLLTFNSSSIQIANMVKSTFKKYIYYAKIESEKYKGEKKKGFIIF